MSRNTHRREKYEAERLQELAVSHPEQFKHEWQRKLQAWAMEAIARGAAAADETTPAEERLPIFGVLEKAERLLALCGEEARQLVGCETRAVLENECCQVFARLAGTHLYRLANHGSNHQLMKSGTHRAHRR